METPLPGSSLPGSSSPGSSLPGGSLPGVDETLTTTIRPGWAGAVARALTGARAWRSPWPWIGVVVVLGTVGVAGIVGWRFAWFLPIIAVVATAGVWVSVRVALRRSIDAALPVGSTVSVTYGSETLTTVVPTETATRPFEHYDRVQVLGPVVLFRVAATKQHAVVPSELVPARIVERYRERVVR